MNDINEEIKEETKVEKKKSKGLVIAIVVLLLIVAIVVIFILMNKDDRKSKDNDTSTTTTSSVIGDTPVRKRLIDDARDFDEKKDGDIIESEYGLFIIDFKNKHLKVHYTTNKCLLVDEDDEDANCDASEFENDENEKYFEFDNVKSIKFNFIDCMNYGLIVVLSEDGNAWYLVLDSVTEEKFIKAKGKYEDVKYLWIAGETCGAYELFMFIDKDGRYFDVITEEEFDRDTYTVVNDIKIKIMINNDIYVDNKKQDIRFYKGITFRDSSLWLYIISEDRYLYEVDGDTNSFTKLKDSKVKEVKEGEKLVIYFENGETLEEEDAELYSRYEEDLD